MTFSFLGKTCSRFREENPTPTPPAVIHKINMKCVEARRAKRVCFNVAMFFNKVQHNFVRYMFVKVRVVLKRTDFFISTSWVEVIFRVN